MRTFLSLSLTALGLAACSTTSGSSAFQPTADASEVLAAEAALLSDARARGVWQAFESALADDAVIFIPHAVAGKDRARNSEATSAREWNWNTQSIVLSCDGSVALVQGEVVTGRDYKADYFSIWERDASGMYKLAADGAFYQGNGPEIEDRESIGEADEIEVAQGSVATTVTACTAQPGDGAATDGPTRHSGVAADGSLRWTLTEQSSGASQLVVEGRKRSGYRAILRHDFPAPPSG